VRHATACEEDRIIDTPAIKGAQLENVRAVIFDFDYTLADSSRGVVECVNYAMGRLGLLPVSAEAACRTIGLSLPDTFVALVGPERAAQADQFTRLFVERADQVIVGLTVVFSTVPGVLSSLRERGLSPAIVSTKYRYRIEDILQRDGLLDAFDLIVGGDDVARQKPHPESLLKAMDALDSAPTSTLYVGDSLTDARTAQAAGVPFVAVLSGKTPRAAFDAYPFYAILPSIEQVPRLLAG